MASYHIQVKGKQLGPFKPTEIKLLVEKGKIGPMDFIRTEGQTNWIQADKVKGLDFSNRPINLIETETSEEIIENTEKAQSNTNINSIADLWHYSKNGKQFGPIVYTELSHLASANQLLPNDMIWKEGMTNWKPAKEIKGLFPLRVQVKVAYHLCTIEALAKKGYHLQSDYLFGEDNPGKATLRNSIIKARNLAGDDPVLGRSVAGFLGDHLQPVALLTANVAQLLK